jgi:hypothetical protein
MNLQFCPQRDVPSISKEKMQTATLSKYDPRTGRTTLVQNCVPYTTPRPNVICRSKPIKCVPYRYVYEDPQ